MTVTDNIAQAGETISYSFSVTNTGTTTLTNIRVTDHLLSMDQAQAPLPVVQ
jgi:uncharacterized repeat protein (TIGR01451 family)